MPTRMDSHRGRFVAAALVALLALLATPYAQQPPPAQPPAAQKPPAQQPPPPPAPGTPPKPLVPLAASTVAENPDPYYGEYVTLTAAVEQILSRTSFSIDQDATKSTGKDVLVIAPHMNGKVDQNAYVTVIGELVKFDPAEIAKKAKDYTLDLPADAAQKYQGKPVVIATSVINSRVRRRRQAPAAAAERRGRGVPEDDEKSRSGIRRAAHGGRWIECGKDERERHYPEASVCRNRGILEDARAARRAEVGARGARERRHD